MRDHREATLLIFTLGAEAESRRRRLVPESWRGEEIALRGACLEAAVEAGRGAGCRVEVSCPQELDLAPDVHLTDQGSGSFGVRLDRAFSTSLRRAGGPVVVVGTDIPDLAAGHVRLALDRLADDPARVVIGPSRDGGFYLLAAARPIEGLASAVSWCCSSTLASLLRTLAEAGREVVLLDPLDDLDRPADLERWLAEAPRATAGGWSSLSALRRLLAERRRPLPEAAPARPVAGFAATLPPRGPPAVQPC